MPKSIDSLSSRPEDKSSKPEQPTSHTPNSTSVSLQDHLEHVAREKKQVRKEVEVGLLGGFKYRWVGIAVVALVLIALAALSVRYIVGWDRFKSYFNQPTTGNYAVIEGKPISMAEFTELKNNYVAFDKQQGQIDAQQSERRAADELILRTALEAQAEKAGVTVTQDDINNYLKTSYANYGSREALLQYNKATYGWTEAPLIHRARLEILKQKMADTTLASVDVLGAYIRWDSLNDQPQADQDTYRSRAMDRLEKSYRPALMQGASRDEFVRSTDVNEFLTSEVNAERLNSITAPNVRYLELKNITNDPSDDQFSHYTGDNQGENAWNYIEQLHNAGDVTPVFKSDSGMYLVLRLEKKTDGRYVSYKQYREAAIKQGQVDSSYYALPESQTDQVKQQPAPQSQSKATSLLSSILPKTYASGSFDCWSRHPLYYRIRPTDAGTLQPITTGNFSVLIARSGKDTCTPYNGFGYFISSQGRQAWTSSNVAYDTEIPLNCYGVVWDFAWSAPPGYENFTAGDYQAPNKILTGSTVTGLRYSPSEIAGVWRNGSIYYGIANGAGRYAVAPLFVKTPVTPTPDPRPRMTVQGWKVDTGGRTDGAYKDAAITLDNAEVKNENPYFFRNILADENHTITASTVPGYDVAGYCLGGACANPTPGTAYTYAANATGNGGVIDLWWYYKPKYTITSTTLNCQTVAVGISTSYPNVRTEVRLDGQSLGEQGAGYGLTIPDQYRDGKSRVAILIVKVPGEPDSVMPLGTHTCPPNGQCKTDDFNASVAAVFPSGTTSVAIGDSVSLRVVMANNGSAIWSNYPGYGAYQLALTPEAAAYWDLIAAPVATATKPDGNPNSYSFNATAKLKASPNSASTPLAFQMAFGAAGGIVTNFGSACSTNLRIQMRYAPWLRVQNGSVAAIDKIVGQPQSARGNRDSVGGDQAINLEASSAILSIASADNFCSTNAYNFARNSAGLNFTAGNGGVVTSCSSGGYKFNVANVFSGGADAFYETVNGLRQASGQCVGQPDPTQPNTRYKDGGTINPGGDISVSDNCPTIYRLSGGTIDVRKITKGRAAILVDGDLTITGNVSTDYSGVLGAGASIAPTLNGNNDVAAMITAQNNAFHAIPSLGIIAKGNVTIDKSVGNIDAMIYAGGKINTCSAYTDGTATGPKDTAAAQQCAKRLVVRGGLYAKNGFSFGRNWYDAVRIGKQMGNNSPSPWTNPSFDYANLGSEAPQGIYSGGPAEDILGNGLGLFNTPPGFEDLSSAGFTSPVYQSGSFQPRF